MAVIGLNGRGKALFGAITKSKNAVVSHVCDVDKRTITEMLKMTEEIYGLKPQAETDFRKILENKDIDAVAIATEKLFIRADILVKIVNAISLYEVKAKSFDPREQDVFYNKNGTLNSEWKPYLYDVAFPK